MSARIDAGAVPVDADTAADAPDDGVGGRVAAMIEAAIPVSMGGGASITVVTRDVSDGGCATEEPGMVI